MGSGWHFNALHVRGVENVIENGLPRWESRHCCGSPPYFLANVEWLTQVLGPAIIDLCFAVVDGSTSGDQLRYRLKRAYASSSMSWCAFRGVIRESQFLSDSKAQSELVQELMVFVAWYCAENGNSR